MGRPVKPSLPGDFQALLKRVGGNIVSLREQKGLSQAELARQAKVSLTTLNEIETRRFRDIRLSTLFAIAKVLDVDISSLILKSDVELGKKDQAILLRASEAILSITKKIKS